MTVDAYVLGRVGADLYPQQINTPLEEVRTFERFVGGFAGNVASGLARLGARVGIISAVGDDGHGRFIRRFLEAEHVDCSALHVHPTLRTALAFCEAWPPDHFPITFYRTPTCPDWELQVGQLPADLGASRILYASGTGLAREPSRSTTLVALQRCRQRAIFDLDWREVLWDDARAYPELAGEAASSAMVVVGGASEFAAAALDPQDLLKRGPRFVVVKRGAQGATIVDERGSRDVAGVSVPVVNGLGAGDAFAAALGAAILEGIGPDEAVRRANAAGAIVASRMSCSTAMPRPGEIAAVLAGATVVSGEVRAR